MTQRQIESNTICMNAMMNCFEKGQQWSDFLSLFFGRVVLRIVDAFLSKFCHLRGVGFVGFLDETQCLYAH